MKTSTLRARAALFWAAAAVTAHADVRVSPIVSDGVVLQRERFVAIFGSADPGESVRVRASWGAEGDATIADAEGRWSTSLRTPAAGGPHTIDVVGKTTRTIRDVWIGEVWLCSGQSNMEMPVAPSTAGFGGVDNWADEVAAGDVPLVHLFTVKNRVAIAPLDEAEGSWTRASRTSVAQFSATAWFFGARVAQELSIPIGLVAADWSGTPAESWTSGVTLRTQADFAARIEGLEREARSPRAAAEARARSVRAWSDAIEESDHGLRDGCERADFDDSRWTQVSVPGTFSGPLLRASGASARAGDVADTVDASAFDGVVWLRRAFDVPPDWAGRDLTLEFGAIDDFDRVFVDGVFVGGCDDLDGPWRARSYPLPRSVSNPGRHTVAVRVLDTGGPGGITAASAASPSAAARVVAGDRELSLTGEWRARAGAPISRLAPRPATAELGPHTPSALYNGMIAPLARFSFRGVIWYQGESNRTQAWRYRELFPALIRDWRARFSNEDMPFYFVQIAPFAYSGDRGETAELREAQRSATEVPGTGMVVTTDVGDERDIHPRNKRDVGARLARLALRRTYGRDVEDSGPTLRAVTSLAPDASGRGGLALSFGHASGLRRIFDSNATFELGDASGAYQPATAVIVGDRVELRATKRLAPDRARFGVGATDRALLVNGEGLPASPLRCVTLPSATEDPWITRREPPPSRWRRAGDVLTLAGPITSWDEAIPLGNGLLGALVWGEPGRLRVSLDRTDLWDLRRPDVLERPEWNWRTMRRLVEARDARTLRELFDAPYDEIAFPTKLPLARFELPLSDAAPLAFTLDLTSAESRVALSSGSVRAFASSVRPLVMMRVEGVALDANWDPDSAFVAGGAAPLGFAVVERASGERRAGLRFEGPGHVTWAVAAVGVERANGIEIAVSVVTGAESSAPLDEALARADRANTIGYARLLGEHMPAYSAVRGRSRVHVGDPAVQTQYDLSAHLLASGSRRGAPPLALQGPWTRDGGLPPWKGDYHNDLNTQTTYLPYATAGMFESGLSFLDFHAELLPRFREFARRFYGVGGAVVPGVMALDGAPLGGWCMYSLSPTNGAWTAQLFARHVRYTGDAAFESERAWPFVSAVADALIELAPPDARGRRRLPLSSSPEIHDDSLRAWLQPNSNYDAALMRSVFADAAALARATNHGADATRYEDVARALEDFDLDPRGALTFARGEPYVESHRHFSHALAIHPLGLISIEGGERERAIVDATLDSILDAGTSAWCGYSFAWFSCLAARAGRPETALRFLVDYERAFTLRNGFHANGDWTGTGLSNFTYRPFTLEGNFLGMEAVHEMLLQSWGGTVRVFPAVSRTWPDVSFESLRAEGGFVVSARRSGGRTVDVRVEATRGGTLRLRDPFAGESPTWNRPNVGRVGADWVLTLAAGEELVGGVSTARGNER